jgi:N-acetylneuraminate lyase
MPGQRTQGLVAAPFTPMHADGSLHIEKIPSYYAMLRANGVSGAFICGSTGEGVSLTMQEKMAVAEAWSNWTKKERDFTLWQLVGGTCLHDCITLAQHAESVGVDAVSFVAPFYFKPPTVEELAACCERIAASIPTTPFYFYHIPVLTGVSFNMIDLLRAIDGRIPNFAGIKYTHEDFMDYLSCLQYGNGKYDMIWGRDETFLSALAIGAKAAIGSTFNYAAPLYHQMIQLFKEGKLDEAAVVQERSIDMIRLLGKYGGIATGKAYMKYIGFDCGEFRLPVRNMDATAFERFCSDADGLSMKPYWSAI